ncbi:MAG TPA: hypothetical protein VGR88_04875, partial [Ktedonobacterales bacterium]|nr:hypothetical protein [Ktedonobacterales bacterium]
EALVTDGGAQREQVARESEEALRTSRQVERRARVALATGIGLLIGGLLAGAGGLAWHPLWGVAGVALISAVAAGVWHSGVRRGLPAAKAAARSAAEALTRLEAREEMARGLPGTAEDLAHIEDALRRAGATPPRTVEEARAQLALAPAAEDATAARVKDDLEAARRALMQRETQYDAASERLDALRSRSAAILGEWALADDLAQPLVELLAARENLLAHVAEQAADADIAPERSAVIVARGTAEVRLRDLRARLDQRERLREDARAAESALREARSELAARLAELIGQARALDIEAIELSAEANNLDLLNLTWKTLHATLATAYMRLGETSERERLAALGSRIEEVDQGARETGLDRAGTIQALRESLATQGVVCAGDETLAELCALWPPLADAAADDPGAVERELLAARNDAYHARESAARAAKARNLEGVTLDEQACRAEVETGELALRRRMTAASMAAETQARIFRRVIPETALHMRALLPALTDGRYRDVELVAENESAGAADLKIRVWDQLAGRFVAKNLFSGGTRDQCSLALRLAFALATLPKEVGATPGFVFLDEPLSSFDSERSRALIEVLTHGAIADQFAQVMLVSHSRSFDQRSFRYRLRMAEGRIVETNLPDEREAERLWAVESAIVESTGA